MGGQPTMLLGCVTTSVCVCAPPTVCGGRCPFSLHSGALLCHWGPLRPCPGSAQSLSHNGAHWSGGQHTQSLRGKVSSCYMYCKYSVVSKGELTIYTVMTSTSFGMEEMKYPPTYPPTHLSTHPFTHSPIHSFISPSCVVSGPDQISSTDVFLMVI